MSKQPAPSIFATDPQEKARAEAMLVLDAAEVAIHEARNQLKRDRLVGVVISASEAVKRLSGLIDHVRAIADNGRAS